MTPHDEDALDNQCICTRTVNPKRTLEFLKSWNTDTKDKCLINIDLGRRSINIPIDKILKYFLKGNRRETSSIFTNLSLDFGKRLQYRDRMMLLSLFNVVSILLLVTSKMDDYVLGMFGRI
jgi:hypothetical protein